MERADIISKGLGLAAAAWIGVYWWWQPGGERDFADHGPTERMLWPRERSSGAAADATWTPEREESEPQVPTSVEPTATRPPEAAAPPERPSPDPSSPKTRPYVVQSGDTIEQIARRELGSITRQDEILRLNPEVDPRRLRLRSVLLLPLDTPPVLAPPQTPSLITSPSDAAATDVPQPTVHVVVEGDNLSSISQRYYGSPAHADVIFQANRSVLRSMHDLRLGQRLTIPPRP